MGGPRSDAPEAAASPARTWAAASARNLARRLRRQAQAAARQGMAMGMQDRIRHLRRALQSHSRLTQMLGHHVHNHGEALAATSGLLSKEEFEYEKSTKQLGNWARHASFAHGCSPAIGPSPRLHEADAAAGGQDPHDEGGPSSDFASCCSDPGLDGTIGMQADFFELDADELDSYEVDFYAEQAQDEAETHQERIFEVERSIPYLDGKQADTDVGKITPHTCNDAEESDVFWSGDEGLVDDDVPAYTFSHTDTEDENDYIIDESDEEMPNDNLEVTDQDYDVISDTDDEVDPTAIFYWALAQGYTEDEADCRMLWAHKGLLLAAFSEWVRGLPRFVAMRERVSTRAATSTGGNAEADELNQLD